MEDEGIMMPVLELNNKYIRPAIYDDLLTIKTYIRKKPAARVFFDYEVFNEKGELLTESKTTLVFVDMKTMKPTTQPDYFKEITDKFF